MAANDLRDKLAELSEEFGTTVFLTTHNMKEAERLCSAVAVIDKGRLLAAGSPQELITGSGEADLEDAFIALMRAEEAQA